MSMIDALARVGPFPGVTSQDLDRLSRFAGVSLSGDVIEYFQLVGSRGVPDRLRALEHELEWAHLVVGAHDVDDLHSLLAEVDQFEDDMAPARRIAAVVPIGHACPGFGGYLWATVGDAGSVVFEADESASRISVHALRLSRFVEGWFLPEAIWRTWTLDRVVSAEAPVTDLVPGATEIDAMQVVAEFDRLLDALMSQRLPRRGVPDEATGLDVRSLIVGGDKWPEGALDRVTRSIRPSILRGRANLVYWMVFGIAITRVSRGYILDGLGLYGQGLGAMVDGADAEAFLLGLRVEGDLDDLGFRLRDEVAVPVSLLHGPSPAD